MSTIEFIATFIVLFFVTDFGLKYFFPAQFGKVPEKEQNAIVLSMLSANVKEGDDPVAVIKNNTKAALTLPSRCPQPPFDVASVVTKDDKEEMTDLMANTTAGQCPKFTPVAPGKSEQVSLAAWKYSLFAQKGTYQISLDTTKIGSGAALTGTGQALATGTGQTTLTTRFTLAEPNVFTKLFRTFVMKPLLNALLFIALYTPGYNLGIAIVILTIIIKLILLIPNQHALEGQKKLQQLQPRLDELKKKYPDDAKKQQEETLRLWKEYNINPLQSCLPTLLQLPILLGLFYVIRSGATLETSRHLLYTFFIDKPIVLGHSFLGFNLLLPSIYVFPPLLVLMQFFQMKMMFAKQKKNKKAEIIDVNAPKSKVPKIDQQTIMTYVLPFMIGFFALRFPAAVSLYWAVSTLFGIAQQWYVNREKITLAKQ